MRLEMLIEQIGTLLVASGIYGLEAEAMASVINELLPEVTEDQLTTAINAAFVDWDL